MKEGSKSYRKEKKKFFLNSQNFQVLGGSSVLNTMLYIRGNRRDFDQWESFGNPGWGYDDILHYFKKSQDQRNPYLARNTKYHSTGNPAPFPLYILNPNKSLAN